MIVLRKLRLLAAAVARYIGRFRRSLARAAKRAAKRAIYAWRLAARPFVRAAGLLRHLYRATGRMFRGLLRRQRKWLAPIRRRVAVACRATWKFVATAVRRLWRRTARPVRQNGHRVWKRVRRPLNRARKSIVAGYASVRSSIRKGYAYLRKWTRKGFATPRKWIVKGYVYTVSCIFKAASDTTMRAGPIVFLWAPAQAQWGAVVRIGNALAAVMPGLRKGPGNGAAVPSDFRDCRGIHLKELGRSYEQSFQGPWGRRRYELALEEGRRKKREMLKFYASISREVPLTVPYVYVALHFQPERTTSSLGGVFADQYLMVDMLARSVPPGWKVYVKEHPSQFYPPFGGERSRHPDFYRDLQDIPNVELVSLKMSSFELLDNSRAVATVTGTVGWEAVIRSKPVLIFGSSWYRYCDGVFYVPTRAELLGALRRIQNGYRPDPRRVRLYMLALDRVCARAGLGYATPDEAEIGLTLDETSARLTAVLRRYWAHMQSHQPGSAVRPH